MRRGASNEDALRCVKRISIGSEWKTDRHLIDVHAHWYTMMKCYLNSSSFPGLGLKSAALTSVSNFQKLVLKYILMLPKMGLTIESSGKIINYQLLV